MKNWKKGCESDLWGRKGRKKEQYLKKRGCRERERIGRKWEREAVHMNMLVHKSINPDLLHENMGEEGDVLGHQPMRSLCQIFMSVPMKMIYIAT